MRRAMLILVPVHALILCGCPKPQVIKTTATTCPTGKDALRLSEPANVDRELSLRPPEEGFTLAPGGAAGTVHFSVYLIALSWAPNFCLTHPDKQQCKGIANDFAGSHLTIHGLWPNYTDEEAPSGATYPQYCGKYSACNKKGAPDWCYPDDSAIPVEMAQYGPGYVSDNYFLANHEWPKHGSCSGLEPRAYFQDAINTLLSLPGDGGTPDALHSAIGGSIALDALKNAFGQPDSVLLSCDKGCNLSQVSVCFAQDGKGNPTTQMTCPMNVQNAMYDNGCVLRHCGQVKVQPAGSPVTPPGQPGGGAACNTHGKGPNCSSDDECQSQGWLRCARSGCCTSVPLPH